MKLLSLLPLAASGLAFVIPNEQVLNLEHVEIQRNPRPATSVFDRLPSKADLLDEIESAIERVHEKLDDFEDGSKRRLDQLMGETEKFTTKVNDQILGTYFDAEAWLETEVEAGKDFTSFFNDEPPHHHPPHDGPRDGPPHDDHPRDGPRRDGPPRNGPPHDGPPHDGRPHDGPPHDGPPHDGPPHDGPPHDGPPHHGPPGGHRPGPVRSNLTVYQLISASKYTTKLAALIDQFDDLVQALNSTGNHTHYTVFAPTDKAFEKIPDHAPKPSKEQLLALLSYHVSPEFYPAGRVLVTRTIPTLLKSDTLGDRTLPQRLSTNIGPRGLTVNFYSRIVAVDIFGTNGVIHGVDSLILPPPGIAEIIDLLPGEFSTLELALQKTGLWEKLNNTDHPGGTLFAPSNFAFQKLGPRINAFLFSKFGLKYLKALLHYHAVPGQTLYSDAYYKPSSNDVAIFEDHRHEHCGKPDGKPHGPPRGPPKGFFHVDLPTFLEDRSLSIDIFRYGRLIEIKINGFARVVVSDGVAKDGVIHVVSDVLIPPKQLGEAQEDLAEVEMSVEEFKQRLEPFVDSQHLGWDDL